MWCPAILPLPPPMGRLGSLGAQALTFPLHACGQALLIAAVLTAVPLALVHRAVLVVPARVGQVLANGAFEEAFAALTTVNPIVFAWGWGRARTLLHVNPSPLGFLLTSLQQTVCLLCVCQIQLGNQDLRDGLIPLFPLITPAPQICASDSLALIGPP